MTRVPATTAHIGLGANLGDRARSIALALRALLSEPGVLAVDASALHETAAVTAPGQDAAGAPAYLNAAAAVRTTLEAAALLRAMLAIERRLGRDRAAEPRWGPRVIDLDLLLFGDAVIDEPGLTVPHPRMHERAFVLAPLAEIAPDAVHPRLGLSVRRMLAGLPAPAPGV